MASSVPIIYLPSGQRVFPAQAPGTWVEAAGTSRGDPLRGKTLEAEISGPIAWLRQRAKFLAYRSSALSVATSTWTSIGLDTELIDTVDGHSDSVNIDRWYVPDLGGPHYYLAFGNVPWAGASDAGVNVFAAGIANTGATPIEGAVLANPAGHDVQAMVCDLFIMDGFVNPYLTLSGWHNHGSNINITSSSHAPWLSVRWVGSSGATAALPAVPHTWTAADEAWASTAGANRVLLNSEIRDRVRFAFAPPLARLVATGSAQTIPSGVGTWTSVQFLASSIDNYGGWSSGANTLYTFPRDGLYFVYGQHALTGTNAGAGTYVAARLHHTIAAGGTADYYGDASVPPTTAATGTTVCVAKMIRAAAGDSVALQGSHNLGAAKPVKNTSNGAARLVAVWMAR